jgi:hypothetical protein
VLYEMTTGRRPFIGKNLLATLHAVTTHSPAPPCDVEPGVPAELSAMVMWLLSKDSANRPESAAEAGAVLGTLATPRAGVSSPPTEVPAVRANSLPARPRNRFASFALRAGVLALLFALAILVRQGFLWWVLFWGSLGLVLLVLAFMRRR